MKDTKTNRDAPVERLLAGTLKARADAAPVGACLDAETLAAWADAALDARERAIAEAHAADCARCQALLAAMVRTAPLPAGSPAAPWLVRSLWWLGPATAAAAALVIWVAVPSRAPVQQSAPAEATADQMALAVASAPADARSKVQADLRPPSVPADVRESAALEKRERPAQEADASPLRDAPAVARAAPPTAAAPVPGAASQAPAQLDAKSNALREAPAAPARVSAFANPLDSVIVSSNPATRIRLLPGGGVQRSADGGATWRTEVTGATETLTAGASPSPSVCWLIGPSGTVLLSTDGVSWRRLAFPERVDLRSVSAADDENATVTTVDGRTFVTADSGRTWSRAQGP